jgi:hypothetical protein
MADYVVKASEEKAQAVEQAVTKLKAKHQEELSAALALSSAGASTVEAAAPMAVEEAPAAEEDDVDADAIQTVIIGSEVPVTVGYVGSNVPEVKAPMSDSQMSEAKRVMASVKSIGNIDVSAGILGEGKGDSDRKVTTWNARNTIPDTSALPASSLYEKVMHEDQSAVAAASQEPLPAATPAMSDGDAATTFASYTSEKVQPGPLTASAVSAQSSAKSTMARVKNIANSDVTSGIMSEGKGRVDGKN